MSLGHAALLAIGAYASALLATDYGVSPLISVPVAGRHRRASSARCWSFRLSACAAITSPSRRSAIGEIVGLVILNWEGLTHGALGVTGIPPLSAFGYEVDVGARASTG